MPETKPMTTVARIEQAPNLEMRFPPLPRTVTDVSTLLAQRTDIPDTPGLIEIVNADPVMAAFVLRRINSAYFGVRRHISDVRKAVFLLGFMEVCNIVLTAAMLKLKDVVRNEAQEKIFEATMKLSVGTAYYAQEISTMLNLSMKETAFTAGLLHGSGRLALLFNRPKEYEMLWFSTKNELFPNPDSERLLFGYDHAQLGAMAAEHWHLPEEVIQVIRYYLTPGHLKDMNLRMIALTIAISASATEQLCMTENNDKLKFEAKTALRILARSLNVPSDQIIEVIAEKRDEVTDYINSMVVQ